MTTSHEHKSVRTYQDGDITYEVCSCGMTRIVQIKLSIEE